MTFSNVIAAACLFVVLGGGAYAAQKLDGRDLKNRSVSGKKVKKNALGGSEIKESTLRQVPRAGSAQAVGSLTADDLQSKILWARYDRLHPGKSTKENVQAAGYGVQLAAAYCASPQASTPDLGNTDYYVSSPTCDYAVAEFTTDRVDDLRKCSFAAVADPTRGGGIDVEDITAGPVPGQTADAPARNFYVAMDLATDDRSTTQPESVPGLSVQVFCL